MRVDEAKAHIKNAMRNPETNGQAEFKIKLDAKEITKSARLHFIASEILFSLKAALCEAIS